MPPNRDFTWFDGFYAAVLWQGLLMHNFLPMLLTAAGCGLCGVMAVLVDPGENVTSRIAGIDVSLRSKNRTVYVFSNPHCQWDAHRSFARI